MLHIIYRLTYKRLLIRILSHEQRTLEPGCIQRRGRSHAPGAPRLPAPGGTFGERSGAAVSHDPAGRFPASADFAAGRLGARAQVRARADVSPQPRAAARSVRMGGAPQALR